MTLGGLCYPFSKKGKGVVLPSAVLTVQPDTRMVMVQGSSPLSSIFCVTSTVVGNSLLSQEFWYSGYQRLAKETFSEIGKNYIVFLLFWSKVIASICRQVFLCPIDLQVRVLYNLHSFRFLTGEKTTRDKCHSPLSHNSLPFPSSIICRNYITRTDVLLTWCWPVGSPYNRVSSTSSLESRLQDSLRSPERIPVFLGQWLQPWN